MWAGGGFVAISIVVLMFHQQDMTFRSLRYALETSSRIIGTNVFSSLQRGKYMLDMQTNEDNATMLCIFTYQDVGHQRSTGM